MPSIKRLPVIAIDGPAGAGKSTVARIIADKMKLLYIDTGAMYRALTWKAIQEGKGIEDNEWLTRLAEETQIQLINNPEADTLVLCDHKDISDDIRSPEVSRLVSLVARVPGVRKQMVRQQRNLGAQGGIVMDGRDIGSEVFPDADFKFFLTASLSRRAERRQMDLAEKGYLHSIEEMKRELIERDRLDTLREVSPLKKVADSITIDSTDMTIEKVVKKMMGIINGGEK